MLWNLKNAWIVLIVYFSCIIHANVSGTHCYNNFKVQKWEFDNDSPPAIITQNLNDSGASGSNEAGIEVWFKDRQEDFNLTIFADPFIKHESLCHRHLQKHENLRQFFETCTIYKQNNKSLSEFFDKIFTGCYYFVMTNKDGKIWQHGPLFYNTSYRYLDTQLKFPKDYLFKPENTNTMTELRVGLEVPLTCIQIMTELFEHESEGEIAFDEIKNRRVPVSQRCFFIMDNAEVKPQCDNAASYTNLTLTVDAEEKENGWTGKMSWKNLRRGGGNYSVHFVTNPTNCNRKYGGGDINTWLLIDGDIWKDLGSSPTNDTPGLDSASEYRRRLIGIVVLGFVIFAILCYWAWKYYHIIRYWLSRIKPEPPGSLFVPIQVPVTDDNESHQILLLYEKGSPTFMKEMKSFGDSLKQFCGNCTVHDVYAMSEGNRVMELGAPGWVLELLEDGSKVVWVDTPEFRSRFNDKQQQYIPDDFRDTALPYAVSVARECFQNATTQYCHHFVVRVKGFEVRDDQDNGPLRVVAPYVRYYYPEQLPVLCELLRTPLERAKKTGDETIGSSSFGRHEII